MKKLLNKFNEFYNEHEAIYRVIVGIDTAILAMLIIFVVNEIYLALHIGGGVGTLVFWIFMSSLLSSLFMENSDKIWNMIRSKFSRKETEEETRAHFMTVD